jgi:hypothetical protein
MATVAEPLPLWFVAFIDSNCEVWFQRLLKPGFRHCFAFGWDENAQRWVYVDPLWETIYLRAFSHAEIGCVFARLNAQGARLVAMASRPQLPRARFPRPRLMLSCVSAIEALLGLSSACAVTPYRLYRTLLEQGAVRIF